MQVEDRLPSTAARVGHQAITALIDLLLHRQLSGKQVQVTDQVAILSMDLVHRRNMFIGHDQDVNRSLGIVIPKGSQAVVLVEDIGGDIFGNDPAEDAI